MDHQLETLGPDHISNNWLKHCSFPNIQTSHVSRSLSLMVDAMLFSDSPRG